MCYLGYASVIGQKHCFHVFGPNANAQRTFNWNVYHLFIYETSLEDYLSSTHF